MTTNDEGRYKIIELQPGTYSIKAVMQGFSTKEKTDLATISGQNVQLDFKLDPAGVTAEQIVTLEGENEPVIDTTRTIVGGTITEREIEEIPNNSRNPLDLVLTLGGVSEEALSTRDLSEDRKLPILRLPLNREIFLFRAEFPIQTTSRLTVWIITTTVRQTSGFNRLWKLSRKFR